MVDPAPLTLTAKVPMRTYILNLIAALFGRSLGAVKHKHVLHITASSGVGDEAAEQKALEKQFQDKLGPDVMVIVTREGVNANQIYIEL